MTVYIIATKVKQFDYYLSFPRIRDVNHFVLEGLKNNATCFINKSSCQERIDSISRKSNREFYIETFKKEFKRVYDYS